MGRGRAGPRRESGSASREAPPVDARERPLGMLAQEVVLVLGKARDGFALGLAADVPGRDERVPAQPARVVARNVEPVVSLDRARRRRARATRAARRPARRRPEAGRRRCASRSRGSMGRPPGRCRSHRRVPRVAPGRAREPPPAPASSRRGSGSSPACPARRALPSGRRRCRADRRHSLRRGAVSPPRADPR